MLERLALASPASRPGRRRGSGRSAGPGRAARTRCSPTPSSSRTSSRPSSIQRLSIEYEGWWMSSGVPSSRRIAAAAAGPLGRVRRRCPRRAPCPAGRPCRARPSSPRAACPGRTGASRRCRRSRAPIRREALVEARQQVLARPAVAVRARPHVVAGLGRDDQLVAVRAQVLGEDPPEVRLGRAVRRAVVVGQVEVGDAEVEGAADDRALRLERPVVAEVVPQPERDRGQLQPAPAARGGRASRRSAPRRRRRAVVRSGAGSSNLQGVWRRPQR